MAEVVGLALERMLPLVWPGIDLHAAHEISDPAFVVLLHGSSPFLVS
jgi:hypothetical protein